ncbi:MAG: trypsin-like peptidase domain-containing protein [Planctomycetota bacterium]
MSDAANRPPRLQLKTLQLPGLPDLIEIPPDGLTFGRSASATIAFSTTQFPNVSGEHARIVEDPLGEFYLEDLGSKNGTLVNNRPVRRHRLVKGDVIQLGLRGPCMVAVLPGDLSETVALHADMAQPSSQVGATTIRRLKRAIGMLEQVEGAHEEIHRRSRRNLLLLMTIAIVGALAIGASFGLLWQRLRQQSRDSASALSRLRQTLDEGQQEQHRRLDAEKQRLEGETQGLARELAAKEAELDLKIAAGATASQDELQKLREQLRETESRLRETRERLDKFKPIDLERESLARRERLVEIRRAVVFLECEFHFRERDSGRELHIQDKDGEPIPTLESEGHPFLTRGFGSGFCISPAGDILTNAHVVHLRGPEEIVRVREWELEPTLAQLHVVFTESDIRLPAEVVHLAEEGDEDLALIRIAPFAGMPFVADFDVNALLPPPGSPVYVFGFPLGSHALQDRDVRASTFAGIVSRHVRHYFQVDAAIYPGNSGGPVVDERGRVIGIASATQTLPGKDDLADSMGYAIPIGSASKVWPPPGPK